MARHWLHVVRTSEYKSGVGVIGLSERWKDTLSNVENGDMIVTYLARRSAFVDLKEVSKGYYLSNNGSGNNQGHPHRIQVRRIYASQTPVGVKALIPFLDFIKNKEHWQSYFDKTFQEIHEEDFDTIRKTFARTGKLNVADESDLKADNLKEVLGNRVPTGIKRLDKLIEGGFPSNSTILVTGGPGTGKTIFCLQFLLYGALNGEPGIYISMDERPNDLRKEAIRFGWDIKALENERKLALVDVSYPRSGIPSREEYKMAMPFTLDAIVSKIVEIISDIGAKRVVIDSLPAFGIHFQDEADIRIAIHRLNNLLLGAGCTSIMTSEIIPGESSMSRFGVEEFISRGTILMELLATNGSKEFTRRLTIMKMRETKFRLRKYMFRIGDNGIEVLPTEVVF